MISQPLKGLQRLREKQKVPQHEIAAVIDVTQSHLNKIEKGQVRLDIYRAYKLAHYLGCRIEDLL
jgi:DNA-binding XRE family transcriptional regulator